MGFTKGIALAMSEGQLFEFAYLDEALMRGRISQEEYDKGRERAYDSIRVDVILQHFDEQRRKEAEATLLGICAMTPGSDPISIDFLPQTLLYSISYRRALHLVKTLRESALELTWERSEEE